MKYTLDTELVIKISALAISLFVFIKGIREYQKAQKWKKLEFLSKEIKEFNNNFDIKRGLVLLDWNVNTLEAKPGEVDGKTQFWFDDTMIVQALKTHAQKDDFTDEETVVKISFDALFDGLTMFENYIESGLITAKDVEPYLLYWVKILKDPNNDRKSKEVREQMWHYIDFYGFDKVRTLCNRFE